MTAPRRRRWPDLGCVLLWAAMALAVVFVVLDWASGSRDLASRVREATVLLVFFVAITIGEAVHPQGQPRMRTADIGATSALALALTWRLPGGPVVMSTAEVALATGAGLCLGAMVSWRLAAFRSLHSGTEGRTLARAVLPRVVTVVIVSLLLREVGLFREVLDHPAEDGYGARHALALLFVVGAVLFVEAPLRHLSWLRRDGRRWPHRVVEDIRETFALGAVAASTAVLVALAQSVLGLPALPLLLVPLVINQAAVRRHELVRHTYRQSVLALSCMPEAAGVVRRGHAARVADLALQVGAELGISGRAAQTLERAALLHDLGQMVLRHPMPGGATLVAAPSDQVRIAEDGAQALRETGVLHREAELVAAQAVPYHHVVTQARALPLESRIIKVVNAFDDLVTGGCGPLGVGAATPHVVDSALEGLYLGIGHEYDPRVVAALERVLRVPEDAGAPGARPARRLDRNA